MFVHPHQPFTIAGASSGESILVGVTEARGFATPLGNRSSRMIVAHPIWLLAQVNARFNGGGEVDPRGPGEAPAS